MASRWFLFVVFVVLTVNVASQSWRGNYRITGYIRSYRRVCAYSTWLACCRYKTVRVPMYDRAIYSCLPGWKHTGNFNCIIPICNPLCRNGGTCKLPNKCKCRPGYQGPTCEGQLCSHTKPCYPGVCSKSSNGGNSVCKCTVGFQSGDGNSGCIDLISPYQQPEIYQCRIRIAQYSQEKQMEKYGLLLDTSDNKTETDEIWTNRSPFNQIYYTGIAFYAPDLPPVPSEYISDVSLGILGGEFTTLHTKIDGRGVNISDATISCPNTASQDNPSVGIFNCSVSNLEYDLRIDNGDKITITFTARAGGYRILNYYGTTSRYGKQYYRTTAVKKTLRFSFDTVRPEHCYPNCINSDVPIDFGGDIKTNPKLNIRWSGWTDSLSGVFRYAWEVFRLYPNGDGELREIKPLEPLHIGEILHSDNIEYPVYTLPAPGLYSIILQIADRANNSQYVRRFCLYDPNSAIQLSGDLASQLRVASAEPESNYTWQAYINGSVTVDWYNYFFNQFLEDNKVLNNILEYPVQFLEEGVTEIKKIFPEYVNKEGRVMASIPNARGIVRFQTAYLRDSNGGKNLVKESPSWINLTNPITTNQLLDTVVSDGDTLMFFVKATDAVGNEIMSSTQVNFDSTPPTITYLKFIEDIGQPGSRVDVLAKDDDSGISHLSWRAITVDTKTQYASGKVPWPVIKQCNDPRKCICFDKFDKCLPLEASLVIDSCDLGIRDKVIEVDLHLDILNPAMLTGGTQIFRIKDISKIADDCITGSSEQSDGLSGGAVAGIIIGMLLLLLIVILVFLFMTNRTPFTKSRKDRWFSASESAIPATNTASKAYPNNAYSVDNDDVYLYGGMEFENEQSWQIPHHNLTLLGTIATGRFAKISQAKIQSKSETVAAKMLKDSYTPEDEMLMRAKVNYMATQVGKNVNVLEFIGAVVDNSTLGPVIILEYCEVGQLDKWLITQRGNINTDVIEILQRIAFGVSKGMTYLASKKIIHKKLAARNVLLTFTREPKITGFGPSKAEQAEDDSVKEKIPIKWTAPECLNSLNGANQKSDVWSYGIVLWEIFSLGETPYTDIKSRDVEQRVRSGYRMSKPEICEDFYYDVMRNCWDENPKKRENFRKIREKISDTFRGKSGDDFYYYP